MKKLFICALLLCSLIIQSNAKGVKIKEKKFDKYSKSWFLETSYEDVKNRFWDYVTVKAICKENKYGLWFKIMSRDAPPLARE